MIKMVSVRLISQYFEAKRKLLINSLVISIVTALLVIGYHESLLDDTD